MGEGRPRPRNVALPVGRRAARRHAANYADANFIAKYGRYTRRPDPEVDDGYVETAPVDAYPLGQSSYGVFDLAGNLGEWVYDVYDHDYYADAPGSQSDRAAAARGCSRRSASTGSTAAAPGSTGPASSRTAP